MGESKKYLLVVQGEGRGHVTQALSMYDMLIEQGHSVCAVILGSSGKREIPKFFLDKIQAPIFQLQSPNFVSDKKNKSIKILKSVFHNFRKIKTFRKSLKTIDNIVKEHEPDVIINFFDLLMGLYFRYYKPKTKMVCIAHQYIYFHPDFEFPNGHFFDKAALKIFARLTSTGSCKNIALSFYKIHTHSDLVTVVPPLLRKEIFDLQRDQQNYYLIYLVNNGYYEEIISWHKLNPDIELHCFTDKPESLLSTYAYRNDKLHLHAINDKLFLEKMSESKGLASSAGFESVCEAMYLGKPVLMVPIQGHFEQFCNSRDAVKAGAGVFDNTFNLSKLINIGPGYAESNKVFKNWVANAKDRIYHEIASV
jgi:uncharacterized protein (TIGR00661 family)